MPYTEILSQRLKDRKVELFINRRGAETQRSTGIRRSGFSRELFSTQDQFAAEAAPTAIETTLRLRTSAIKKH